LDKICSEIGSYDKRKNRSSVYTILYKQKKAVTFVAEFELHFTKK